MDLDVKSRTPGSLMVDRLAVAMKGPSVSTPTISLLITIALLFASPSFAQPGNSPGSLLQSYKLADKNPPTARLPRELREISGLACDGDGRILCHNDEQGIVFQIDPVQGTITRRFSVGDRVIRRDYEGIAVAESLIYVVTSDGRLFEFTAPRPGGRAAVQAYSTGLASGWDVEGLCYDSSSRSLLLACKEHPAMKRFRHIYAYSLKSHSLDKTPRFVIDLQTLQKRWQIKEFHPSAIERHPVSGTIFVLSSSEPAILELTSSGDILAAAALPHSAHRQPEGLTFGADFTLYISNEGKDYGTVVRYPYKP